MAEYNLIMFDDRLYCRRCKTRRAYVRDYERAYGTHLGLPETYLKRVSYCTKCGYRVAEDRVSLDEGDS